MIENNYRSDIKFVTNDYRLANLIRMMNYEKIKYSNSAPYFLDGCAHVAYNNSVEKYMGKVCL